MSNCINKKSGNKESKYLAAKHELEKLGLNIDQTNDIEQYVERIMERSR